MADDTSKSSDAIIKLSFRASHTLMLNEFGMAGYVNPSITPADEVFDRSFLVGVWNTSERTANVQCR
jgi:hypothetical protein